jgi:hypothetical protein
LYSIKNPLNHHWTSRLINFIFFYLYFYYFKKGTSKTLSFNLATNNDIRKFFPKFKSVQSVHYQCSKNTTDIEILNLFEREVELQRKFIF